MNRTASASAGRLVAEVLTGAWRQPPPALQASFREVIEIAPLLLSSGAGALTWRKIQGGRLTEGQALSDFQQVYRFYSLQSTIQEERIKNAFRILRAGGVEPIIVKGWAIARIYPEPGLRPYTDIDICVRPEQISEAQKMLKTPEGQKSYLVDLHEGFTSLDDQDFDKLYERSRLVTLDDVHVRVLGLEDHLRVLCLHLLRHGAWRPLWLCDVAVAVEARPGAFDWNRCFGGDKRRADWVACTIALAHELLGASVEGVPLTPRAKRLPRWLAPSVLKQWGAPYPLEQSNNRHRAAMASYLRNPNGLIKDIGNRWPNPIEATISLNGAVNGLPRFPYQVGNGMLRAMKFLASLPRSLREPG